MTTIAPSTSPGASPASAATRTVACRRFPWCRPVAAGRHPLARGSEPSGGASHAARNPPRARCDQLRLSSALGLCDGGSRCRPRRCPDVGKSYPTPRGCGWRSTRAGWRSSISSRANSVQVRLIDRVPRMTSRVTGSRVRSPKLNAADLGAVVRDRSGAAGRASGQQLLEGERFWAGSRRRRHPGRPPVRTPNPGQ